MMSRSILILVCVSLAAGSVGTRATQSTQMPRASDSLKFAVLGNSGTGSDAQVETAKQVEKVRQSFPFELVLLTGNNVTGSQRPQDFIKTFEGPYKPLLSANVRFYAVLGSKDDPKQQYYQLFNMNRRRYYAVSAKDVQFFVLDTKHFDAAEVAWLDTQLTASHSGWKIVVLHDPLYSSAPPDDASNDLRAALEPLLVKHQVSAVFAGRDQVYERSVPQQGITHFVVGSSGRLHKDSLDRSSKIRANGFDRDNAFVVAEVVGNQLFFSAISRTGEVVDSGVIARR